MIFLGSYVFNIKNRVFVFEYIYIYIFEDFYYYIDSSVFLIITNLTHYYSR